MARLNWDRLRRTRPLDGADERVDPDGAHLWERPAHGVAPAPPLGVRRLRHGVILRRRAVMAASAEGAPPPEPDRHRCRDCGVTISPRKILRHKRRCPARPSALPGDPESVT